MKRLSPAAVVALEEALTAIYHYKNDLRRFLEIAIKNKTLVDRYHWENTGVYKRQIVRELVGLLCGDQDRYLPALTQLCLAVVELNSFEHLARLDDGARRVREAKTAVTNLRELVEPHKEAKDEELEARERQRRANERLKQNSAVRAKLAEIKAEFYALATSDGKQERGYQLEKILRGLFDLFDLDPKASFKITGEQIDGGFAFQGTDYLLEARWTKTLQDASALYEFDGKVRRKLDNTLGLFLAINGFSAEALPAVGAGDRPRVILMDGADLVAVLDERIELGALILRKKQHAARTGNIFLQFHELTG